MKHDFSALSSLVDAVSGIGSIENAVSQWREQFQPTNEWQFTAKPGKDGGFIAWCAKCEYLGNGPLEIPLDVEVYFEFGETAEEAIAKLKRGVLN